MICYESGQRREDFLGEEEGNLFFEIRKRQKTRRAEMKGIELEQEFRKFPHSVQIQVNIVPFSPFSPNLSALLSANKRLAMEIHTRR